MVWILTILATLGSFLVLKGKIFQAWGIWTFTNSGFLIHNLQIGEYAQAGFFLANLLITLAGCWQEWQKQHVKK